MELQRDHKRFGIVAITWMTCICLCEGKNTLHFNICYFYVHVTQLLRILD